MWDWVLTTSTLNCEDSLKKLLPLSHHRSRQFLPSVKEKRERDRNFPISSFRRKDMLVHCIFSVTLHTQQKSVQTESLFV